MASAVNAAAMASVALKQEKGELHAPPARCKASWISSSARPVSRDRIFAPSDQFLVRSLHIHHEAVVLCRQDHNERREQNKRDSLGGSAFIRVSRRSVQRRFRENRMIGLLEKRRPVIRDADCQEPLFSPRANRRA
jgi:hypothetical protein